MREKHTHTWTKEELHEILRLSFYCKDPEAYAKGAEQNYLDGILRELTPLYAAMNKKLLKPVYVELINIVSKCLLGNYGILEQISNIKLGLVAAIVNFAIDKKRFNCPEYFISKLIEEKRKVKFSGRLLFAHRMTFAIKASVLVESLKYTENKWVNPYPLSKIIYKPVSKKGKNVDVAT